MWDLVLASEVCVAMVLERGQSHGSEPLPMTLDTLQVDSVRTELNSRLPR